MGRVRAEPTATLGRVAPPERHLGVGVGKQRDVQQERRKSSLADGAAPHDARQERLSRSKTEFATDEVYDLGALRGDEQHSSLGRVARERLFTQDMLVRSHGVEHERCVRVRRCRNRHCVDARDRERFRQAGEGMRDLEAFGARRRLVGVAPDERVHFEARRPQGAHMCEATETGPHDGGTDAHAGMPAAFATIDSIVY